jgi:hypothetical protein
MPILVHAEKRPRALLTGSALRPDWSLLALALLSLPWLILWLVPPINLDVAAVLQFSERWVAGEQLYVDLVDVNPPLVFMLYAVPVLLSGTHGLGVTAAFNLCLLLFVLLVGRMVWRRILVLAPSRSHLLLMAGGVPFAVAALSTLMAGQREHLLAVAILPWLFDAALRAQADMPWRRTVPAALLAALGLCLKPHFLAIPLLVEGWLALRRFPRPWADAVPWAMAALFTAYGALIWLAFPTYPREILPLAFGTYATFADMTPLDVLLQDFFLPCLALLLACLPFARKRGGPVGVALALAACGAVIGAMAQGKGWPYHYLPAEILTVLLVAWLLGGLLASIRRPALQTSLRLGVAAMFLANCLAVATRVAPWSEWGDPNSPLVQLAAGMRQEAPHQPVLVLSPVIGPIFPAMAETETTQAMRFMSLWVLEAAYAHCPPGGRRYRELAEMGSDERFVFNAVSQDFARRRPRLVVVDRHTDIPKCDGPFEFDAYFKRNPEFAEAFAQYVQVRDDGRFRFFTRID